MSNCRRTIAQDFGSGPELAALKRTEGLQSENIINDARGLQADD